MHLVCPDIVEEAIFVATNDSDEFFFRRRIWNQNNDSQVCFEKKRRNFEWITKNTEFPATEKSFPPISQFLKKFEIESWTHFARKQYTSWSQYFFTAEDKWNSTVWVV